MIEFRPSEIGDLELLKFWDTQPHVIASDPDDDWEWEVELNKNPPWREQLVATLEGRPIGFVQIIDPAAEETHYWGKVPTNLRAIDIWIGLETDLNKGYGTEMMRQAIDRCFSDPDVEAILIDPLKSNTKAHRFYERLGFRFQEERNFYGQQCLVYRLDR